MNYLEMRRRKALCVLGKRPQDVRVSEAVVCGSVKRGMREYQKRNAGLSKEGLRMASLRQFVRKKRPTHISIPAEGGGAFENVRQAPHTSARTGRAQI